MKKVIYSVRIGTGHWENDAMFEDLLAHLKKYSDCIQQVAFFTNNFHSPMTLEMAKERCTILKDRVARVKALGMSCGLNILATIGHHPERLEDSAQGDWTYNTNIDGEVCLGSRCMNNPKFLEEYVGPLYRLHCEANPDFIWIDDDVRAGHLPIGFVCFCDNCIAKFNKDYGYDFTREQLKAAFEAEGGVELRKQWLSHQTDKYVALFKFIRQTVNAYDDGIMLGMMTGERYFEGYDFAAWAQALSDDGKYEIMWRPGGGNYRDDKKKNGEDSFVKSSQVGRQCANLPAYVTSIQSEIENFPHRPMDKGERYTALETLMHVSTGCTAAALNIMVGWDTGESASIMDRHMDEIRRTLPFAKKLSKTVGRRPAVGVHCGWSINSQAAVDGPFAKGYGGSFFDAWEELYFMGIPEGYDFDAAPAYMLTGRTPLAFSKEELQTILSRGVYMDGEAATVLNEMGYGDLVGFTVGRVFEDDSVEVYEDHPLNKGFVGNRRFCPEIFCKGTTSELIPAAGAEVLCRLEDYHGNVRAACSMGLFRNRLGGTVCVCGHYALTEQRDTQRSVLMKRLFRLMSNDTLPIMVESYHRVRAVARLDGTNFVATLLNTSLDNLTDVTVLLPASVKVITVTDEAMNETVLAPVGEDGNMNRFVIPTMRAMSMLLIAE